MQFLFGATGGGGGGVSSVNGGVAITIDNTDPANPAVNLKYAVLDPNIGIDGGNQLYFRGDSGTIRQFSTVPGFFITDALDYLATHYIDNIVPSDGIIIDDTDPINPIIGVSISANSGLEFVTGALRVVADTTTISINGSGQLSFIGGSDDVTNDSLVAGATVSDALETLQSAILAIAPNFETVLGNGNTTTLTAVFDAGGGSQTQISAGQVLAGSSTGTASMDATGVIYSTDNGAPELRTVIQFDTITITKGGIGRVEIDSTSTTFTGPAGQVISIDPTIPNITIAVGGGFAQLGSDTLLYSDGGGNFLKLAAGIIDDNASGFGIDFGGTTGIINFPGAGFQLGAVDAAIANDGSGITMTVKSGSAVTITDGFNTGGIRTDAGATAGSTIWRLGSVQNNASVLDSTQYVEVDVNGTLVKLCMAV